MTSEELEEEISIELDLIESTIQLYENIKRRMMSPVMYYGGQDYAFHNH